MLEHFLAPPSRNRMHAARLEIPVYSLIRILLSEMLDAAHKARLAETSCWTVRLGILLVPITRGADVARLGMAASTSDVFRQQL